MGDGDDGCARGFFLNLHVTSHLDATATSVEVAVDAFEAADFALTGEIGAFDILLQFIDRKLGIIDTGAYTINHFAQVVGGDVGGHSHRDTGTSIDQQVRNRGWQDNGFVARFIVCRLGVDGIFFKISHHRRPEVGQAGFGVSHRRGGVTFNRTKVSLAVDENFTHRPWLRHVDQGGVD